jgi:hypothetical protein
MQKCLLMWVARTIPWSALALILTGPATSAILTSTFGPGGTFSSDPPYVIGNAVFQAEIAAPFTPGITAKLEKIRIAVSFSSGVNDFTVYIAPDIGGEPGAPLESFTGLHFDMNPGVLTLNSLSHPRLRAGSPYLVVITAPDLINSQGGWHVNNQGFSGLLARNFFGNFVWVRDTAATPAFDVSGTLVPEPSTFRSTFLGLLIAAVSRQLYVKRNRTRPAMLRRCKLTV